MNFCGTYVDVILPLKLRMELTYSVPDDLVQKINIGQWVVVRLKGKKYLAVTSRIHRSRPELSTSKVLPIDSISDLTPVSQSDLDFWKVLAQYYMCSVGEVMKAAYSTNFQRQLNKTTSRLPKETDKAIDQKMAPTLSEIQQTALSEIKKAFADNRIAFLHGVTGSGKTEIYIILALEAMLKGKSVIYLVPEIAISRQLKNRLEKIFGNTLLTFHSKQTVAQKKNVFSKLNDSQNPYIVLGTRSSVFLPHNNIGLVIVDEEHDSSYKQTDPAPRYNGRDAAIMMSSLFEIPIVLGSATPSFETIYNVETGKYAQITLNCKYHQSIEPKIEVIDMNMVHRLKNHKGSFSIKALNEIRKTVEAGEQVMVFRSRRAYSPIVQCTECGAVPKCPHCNVMLSYHKFNNSLECHYCGYRKKFSPVCPECGQSALLNKGAGTEKIEEELKEYFPDYIKTRFDADTTSNKSNEQTVLKDFASGKIDILVGTQMITKGFDFEKLSLVVVIQADSLFAVQDFRADERALQLLTQLRGRAGRRQKQGKMMIQTSQPEHPVLKSLIDASRNMEERRIFSYPPYVRLILITVKDKFEWRLDKVAKDLTEAFKRSGIKDFTGAVVPAVDKVNGQTINQFWLKLPKDRQLKATKLRLYQEIEAVREKYKDLPTIIIDVDPY